MNKQNVVIVGVLDVETSSNIWMATSLVRFGFNVIPVNYRTLIKNYGADKFANILINAVKIYKPVLTIFCKCNGVDPVIIKEVSKLSHTFLYYMDSHKNLITCPEIIDHAKNVTFSGYAAEDAFEFINKHNIKNTFIVREGIDVSVHKPIKYDKNYDSEVCFIAGNKTDERDRYYNLLKDNNIDVKFYGPYYSNEYIKPDKWSIINLSSKFTLSVGTFKDLKGNILGRVYESIACGACLLHFDDTNTIDQFFDDKIEILKFSSDEELINLIKNTSDEEAGLIALKGRDKCIKQYSWDNSVYQILTILKGIINK